MKKFVVGSLFALVATSSMALDVTVSATRDLETERNAGGIAVGHTLGPVHASLGFERFAQKGQDLNRYHLMGSYTLIKSKLGDISAKAGGAYLDNERGADGYAAVVGVGYSLPLTKVMSVGVDFTRQYGQDRVSAQDGNRVSAGLTVKF